MKLTKALMMVSLLFGSASMAQGLASPETLVQAKVKSWKAAFDECAKTGANHKKWRLINGVEAMLLLMNSAPVANEISFDRFDAISSEGEKAYPMWVQGIDDAETKQISNWKTVAMTFMDGAGTDGRPLDLVKDIAAMGEEIAKTDRKSLKDDEAVRFDRMVKAYSSLKDGLAPICVPADFKLQD